MSILLQPLQDLARGASCAVRAALWRAALIGAALLIASVGAGFLMFAAYLGLRHLTGPLPTALIMGAALLAVAAGILLWAQSAKRTAWPLAKVNPQAPLTPRPPRPADAATMAVFMAAFLLGRSLAADRASRRGRSGSS